MLKLSIEMHLRMTGSESVDLLKATKGPGGSIVNCADNPSIEVTRVIIIIRKEAMKANK